MGPAPAWGGAAGGPGNSWSSCRSDASILTAARGARPSPWCAGGTHPPPPAHRWHRGHGPPPTDPPPIPPLPPVPATPPSRPSAAAGHSSAGRRRRERRRGGRQRAGATHHRQPREKLLGRKFFPACSAPAATARAVPPPPGPRPPLNPSDTRGARRPGVARRSTWQHAEGLGVARCHGTAWGLRSGEPGAAAGGHGQQGGQQLPRSGTRWDASRPHRHPFGHLGTVLALAPPLAGTHTQPSPTAVSRTSQCACTPRAHHEHTASTPQTHRKHSYTCVVLTGWGTLLPSCWLSQNVPPRCHHSCLGTWGSRGRPRGGHVAPVTPVTKCHRPQWPYGVRAVPRAEPGEAARRCENSRADTAAEPGMHGDSAGDAPRFPSALTHPLPPTRRGFPLAPVSPHAA